MTVDETGPDTDNIQRWNPVDEFDQYFYAYFWSGMPDFNYDNPAVRDSVIDIGQFWLEKGVDGFRLDAAKHISPEGREAEIHAWWETFRAEMEAVNPDVLLVGEVWDDTEVVKQYLTGLLSLFNFDMAGAMMEAVQTGSGTALAEKHAEIRRAYQSVTDDFVDATFLTNHDQNRVMSVLDDEAKARVAAGLLFTLPGAPYVYYGEEIGMRGMKPDPHIREPMLWTNPPDTARTTWIGPEHSTDAAVTPVEVQNRSEYSLLAHYRELIALRNSSPALTFGEIEPVRAEDDELVVFLRRSGEESLLVMHNVSGTPVVTDIAGGAGSIIYQSDEAIRQDGATISLPAYSTVVFELSR